MNRKQHKIEDFDKLTPEIVLELAAGLQMDKLRGVSLTSPAMTTEYLQAELKTQDREKMPQILSL